MSHLVFTSNNISSDDSFEFPDFCVSVFLLFLEDRLLRFLLPDGELDSGGAGPEVLTSANAGVVGVAVVGAVVFAVVVLLVVGALGPSVSFVGLRVDGVAVVLGTRIPSMVTRLLFRPDVSFR